MKKIAIAEILNGTDISEEDLLKIAQEMNHVLRPVDFMIAAVLLERRKWDIRQKQGEVVVEAIKSALTEVSTF